ncbi:MAG: DUF6335 family protein [Oscillatoriaceae cyanobacterium Prado104]|nr:DUF6335 family protein [Oscillatoriaceae cyanobacterium Prado104]
MAQRKKTASKATEESNDSSELPQVITESYGTGVIDKTELSEKDADLDDSNLEDSLTTLNLNGGNVGSAGEKVSASGEEDVGGSTPTPDQDIVDELGAAAGIEMDEGEMLHAADMLENRDESRWELDPMSAEDYQERDDSQEF